MNMKKILTLLAACLLLIGAIVGVVSAQTPAYAAGQYNDLDYRVPNQPYQTVYMGDVLEFLLDKEVSEAEKNAIQYEFDGLSGVYYTAPETWGLDVTYDGQTKRLIILVEDFYGFANGNELYWIPFRAKVGELVADFELAEDINDYTYRAVVENVKWTDEQVSIVLEYTMDVSISAATLNGFVNFAYDKSIELDQQYDAYEIKLSEYEAKLNAYNANVLEWDAYNAGVKAYEAHLAQVALYRDYQAYQQYLTLKAKYDSDYAAYQANQAAWTKYNSDTKKYAAYLTYLQQYPSLKSEYDKNLPTMQHQLGLLAYMQVEDPVTGISFMKQMVDDDVTQALISHSAELGDAVGAGTATVAKESAAYIQNFCKEYQALTTDEQRYTYYIQEYSRLVKNLSQLFEKMTVIYEDPFVYAGLKMKYPDHIYRLPRMLGQLYVYSTMLNDGKPMNVSTVVDSRGNQTVAALVDASTRPAKDTNKATPLATCPKEPVHPNTYEVTTEPTKPSVTLSRPTAPVMPTFATVNSYLDLPTTMEDPGVMSEPVPPSKRLEKPTRPELGWSDELHALYRAYLAGEIMQRELFSQSQPMTLIAEVPVSYTMEESEHYCFVNFYNTDAQNTLLASIPVFYGEAGAYPSDFDAPTKTDEEYDYTFSNWVDENGDVADLSAVTEDMNLYAAYDRTHKIFDITFVVGGNSFTQKCEYGFIPVFEGSTDKASDAQYQYRFIGWDKQVVAAKNNVTYTAQYEKIERQYTVTFVIGDRTITQQCTYGHMPEPPTDTSKPSTAQYSYTFLKWDKDLAPVTGDVTYTAQYAESVRKYTVTFVVGDRVYSEEYEYGQTPVAPKETDKPADAQYTYIFAGWDKAITAVKGDTTYTAQYVTTSRQYSVIFIVGDVIYSQTYSYGEDPEIPTDTSKPSTAEYNYTFAGWDKEIVSVTGNAIYTAQYTEAKNKYTVTFIVGNQSYEQQCEYGTTPTEPENTSRPADAQYTYTFKGWNKPIAAVTGNVTYIAQYDRTVNKYTITFVIGDKVIEKEYEYGKTPEAPDDTSKPATVEYTYTFKGWDKALVRVTRNATYTAQYTATKNKYTVTFIMGDHVVEQQYEYGSIPHEPDDTSKPADAQYTYIFTDWDKEVVAVTGDVTYTAMYSKVEKQYTVTFIVDGQTYTRQYAYGADPLEPETSKPSTAEYTYTFIGWDKEVVAVTGDVTYTAQYEQTIRKYTVTFVVGDKITQTQYEYGATPIAPKDTSKPANAQYTFTFTGWDKEIAPVIGDITYTAKYNQTVNKYTVTFIVGDKITHTEYSYGEIPVQPDNTSKPADAQYTYTFKGWDNEIVAVTGNVTYTAEYDKTVNEYTITFIVGDKTITKRYEYGATPEAPEDTSKPATAEYTYTFTGWGKDIVEVTGDATYTAQYSATKNKYTVTFIVGDQIHAQQYEYGTTPIAPDTFKPADAQYTYTFTGWDKDIVKVTGNTTYTAKYSQTVNKYTVSFVVGDQTYSEQYAYGAIPTAPVDTSKPADAQYTYTFKGWDKEIAAVMGDVTYTAEYEETVNKYTITFIVGDKTISEQYAYGTTPAQPEDTSKPATAEFTYTFTGWDKEIVQVTGDATYTAEYNAAKNKYTVTFVVGDTITETEYEYGATPVEPKDTSKPADAQYTYTFAGWDKAITTVKGNVTYTAQYGRTLNQYTVTFIVDGKAEQYLYPYGEIPTAPDTFKPADAQYTYTFKGWDNEIVAVTGNVTYTAEYDKTVNKYTITFIIGDQVFEEEYEYGATPAEPKDTTKPADAQYTYTFKGWDKEIAEVTGDMTYTAEYDRALRQYTVTFIVGTGTVTQQYAYGATPEAPNDTSKPANAQYTYTFAGWDNEFVPVKGDVTYTARYTQTVNQYTVTFVVGDRVIEQQYEYGSIPREPNDTSKPANAQYTYTFKGWDKEIAAVMGDVTYTAEYEETVNKYTITFIVGDKTISEQYAYGTTPAQPEDTSKPATAEFTYTFTGWDKEIVQVTGDATYTAEYNATKNKYTVTFVVGDTITETEYEHGATPVEPTDTSKPADAQYTYTFAGWDKAITTVKGNVTYTAQYGRTLNQYTVTFIVDGKAEQHLYPYGEIPTAPDTFKPADAQYTYTFKGWDNEIVAVIGNVTYTAEYDKTVNKYTITFIIGDQVFEEEYEYGATPAEPKDTTKPATAEYTYTFTGWDKEIVQVTGDATYTAEYNATKNKYTVTFVVGDTITETEYEYGATPVEPKDTSKPADAQYTYTFAGWDKAITTVKGNVTYTAQYGRTLNQYTVTFVVGDKTITDHYEYGTTPTAPADIAKPADAQYTYTFKGWDNEIVAVTGNVTYTAEYDKTVNKYTITFIIGDQLFEEEYEYGATPAEPEDTTKPADAQYTYTFTGWDKDIVDVTGNATYIAQYDRIVNKYTITFIVGDKTITEQYEYGQTPVAPEDTTKPADAQYTYIFTDWDKDIVKVTGDATYTAEYDKTVNTYTIIFIIGDKVIKGVYEYGATPAEPEDTSKPATAEFTYTFTGWDKEIVQVTGDATYTAEYNATKNKYTVTFIVGDTITETEYEYGATPVEPNDTSKPADAQYTYTFAGWDKAITTVKGDVTYTAQYGRTLNQYTVTWVVDGQQITEVYGYGEMPSFGTENPRKQSTAQYEYVFEGWDQEIGAVSADVTYTARFTAVLRSYTVKFVIDGVEHQYTLAYGAMPQYDGTPTKASTEKYEYSFLGWDKELVAVTGDAQYVARFTQTLRQYPVIFVVDGEEYVVNFAYGTTPQYPYATPSKPADAEYRYVFTGWTPELAPVTAETVTYTACFDAVPVDQEGEDTEPDEPIEPEEFIVEFYDYDESTLLATVTVSKGGAAIYPNSEPVKLQDVTYTYTFIGWVDDSGELVSLANVVQNIKVYAAYASTLRQYTITFVIGNRVEQHKYAYGTTPAEPDNTSKPATAEFTYTFTGWDKEIVQVTGDATYTAEYNATKNKYTVTFVVGDTITETEYEYGATPEIPEDTSKPADAQYTYTFAGWDKAITTVKGNVTYTAQYGRTLNQYTVTFIVGDKTITDHYEYGTTPTAPADTAKPSDAQYTYTFKGWDNEIVAVTGNVTYTAEYDKTVNKYTITFIIGDQVFEEEYEYGATPEAPKDTSKPATAEYTYTFTGWGKDIAKVTGDATYTAQYNATKNKYTVTFIVGDQTYAQQYEYGTIPQQPENTSKPADAQYAYVFIGWDKDIVEVTGDVTYTAEYEKTTNRYTVTFVIGDQTIVLQYAYGQVPQQPSNTAKPADAQYTYTFKGWDKEIVEVTGDVTYTAEYEIALRQYTITFVVGTGIITQRYEYGTTPEAPDTSKPATAEFTYTFTGWDKEIAEVTGDATYTAQYNETKNKYTVTFIVGDTEIKDEYEYGATPVEPKDTSKPADAQYTYTFAGWDKPVTTVKGNVTYTAQYGRTLNQYTVTFVVGDKTITDHYEYGTTPTAPADTAKPADAQYTYSFKGWDNEIVAVTGNVTYTAEYDKTVNEYTITFIVGDKTITKRYEYGATPEAPKDTSKPATAEYTYTFTGWEKDIVEVTGDATYTAQYSATKNKYTVTFIVGDQTHAQQYEYGTTPIAPDTFKPADAEFTYTFTGWDKEIAAVTGDVTYTAQYRAVKNKYTVTFIAGNKITELQYEYGTTPIEPTDTSKPADAQYTYTFKCWDKEIVAVTGDATYTAKYDATVNVYTVTFVVGDKTIAHQYAYGQIPVQPEDTSKPATAQFTYTFTGWNTEVVTVTGDAIYIAQYAQSIRRYTVTFNIYGKIEQQQCLYGSIPQQPINTAKPSTAQYTYTFAGWDKEIVAVTQDVTYIAQYNSIVNQYIITFIVGDKTVSQLFEYGATVQPPADTAKPSDARFTYTFQGWDKEIETVTGDATYSAEYKTELRQYTITFIVDGKIEEHQYAYGTTVQPPENTAKPSTVQWTYTFKGWDKEIETVTGDATYTAVYESVRRQYTVTFVTGTETITQQYAYGALPQEPENVSKPADAQYTYTFKGWDNEIVAVTGNVTYTAEYDKTVNKYTITFIIGDQVFEEEYEYGATPEAPKDTSKPATAEYTYTFTDWDKEIVQVTGDATYTAQYNATKNKYTVTFIVGDKITQTEYEYGATPIEPKDTSKPADAQYTYTFNGWDKVVTPVKGDVTYTAQYESTVNQYTVTFIVGDQTYTQQYAYGATPQPPANTSKPSDVQYTYNFAGWDKPIAAVKGNVTYTAQYGQTLNQYTVTFIVNGNTEQHQYPYGTMPEQPENTSKPADVQYSYTFTGWDEDIVVVTGDKTYTAQYDKTLNQYTVTFVIGDQIQQHQYLYGEIPQQPTDTSKPSTQQYTYTFNGWDKEVVTVVGNVTYTAQYTQSVRKYTVTVIVGDRISTEQYAYGAMPQLPIDTSKPADAQYTYTFTSWDNEPTAVTGDITYTAQYEKTLNRYSVIFIVDGKAEQRQYVYGEMPEPPANVSKPATQQYTFTFTGWDKKIATVTGDATYVAQFEHTLNQYTITWVVDGQEFSQVYSYGATPSFGEQDPHKDSTAQFEYRFTGWDQEIVSVNGDAVYTAAFTEVLRSYTVEFVVDGVTQSFVLDYGIMPQYDGTPSKESTAQYDYTFLGWDKELVMVTGDAQYEARFESTLRQYPVIFVVEGEEYVVSFDYGAIPQYPNQTPSKPADEQFTYTFTGWDKELVPVTEQPVTYTACFQAVPIEEEKPEPDIELDWDEDGSCDIVMPEQGADVDFSKIFETLGEQQASSLNVKFENGSLTFPKEQVDAFYIMGGVTTIDLMRATNQEGNVTYEIVLRDAQGQPAQELIAEMTVRIPYSGATAADVYRIKQDGTKEKVESVYVNGYLEFSSKEAATFAVVEKHTIGVVPPVNGVVNVVQSAGEGEQVTVTLTPNEGFNVGALMIQYNGQIINVEAVNGVYTFTMPAYDIQIITSFIANEHFAITVKPSENGVIDMADQANVGDSVSIYPDPDDGYRVGSITIEYNGEIVEIKPENGEYSFIMPNGNVTVTATFTPIKGGTGIEVLIGVITAILIVAVGIVVALVLRKKSTLKI